MSKSEVKEIVRLKQLSRFFLSEHASYIKEERERLAEIAKAKGLLLESQRQYTDAGDACKLSSEHKVRVQQESFDPRQRQIVAQLHAKKEAYINERVRSQLQKVFFPLAAYTHTRQLVIDELIRSASKFTRDAHCYRQVVMRACGTALSYYFHRRGTQIATENDLKISEIIKGWMTDIKCDRMPNLSKYDTLIKLIQSSPLNEKQTVKLIGFIELFTRKPSGKAKRLSADYLAKELIEFVEDNKGVRGYLPRAKPGLKTCWQEAEIANVRYVPPVEIEVPDGASIAQACEIGDRNEARLQAHIDLDSQGETIQQLSDLRALDCDKALSPRDIEFLRVRIDLLPLTSENKQLYISLLTDRQGLVVLNEAQRDHVLKFDQLAAGLAQDDIDSFSDRLSCFSCGSHTAGSLTERVRAVHDEQGDEIASMLAENQRLKADIKAKQKELHVAERAVEKSERELTAKEQAFTKFEELNAKKYSILKDQLNNARAIFSKRREQLGAVNRLFVYSSMTQEDEFFIKVNGAKDYAELCFVLHQYFQANTKCREADLTSAIVQVLFHSEDGLFSVKTSASESSFSTHRQRIGELAGKKRPLTMRALSEDSHSGILTKKSRFMFFVHTNGSSQRKQAHEGMRECLQAITTTGRGPG